MHLPFSSVQHENNAFDDSICTFKSQIKVLKEHIFEKRVQNDTDNKHKANLSDGNLLVHVNFAKKYSNDQQNEIKAPTLEIKAFCSLHRVVILKV